MSEKKKRDPKLEALKEVMTTEARCSHPHLFEPSAIKKGAPAQYSIELLFDKQTTDLKHLQAPCVQAMKQHWGPNKEDWPENRKMPYRDGDKPYGKKKEVKPEHKGMWVVKASSSGEYARPHTVGKNPKIALTKPSEIYPGCYVRGFLKAHAYDSVSEDVKPGVKFILNGIQFMRDGDALGGKKPADQMFGVIEDEDSFDDVGDNFDDAGSEESFDDVSP